ncbi:MAG: NUDIX domain-containing protein [Minicystis sp.]
MTRKSLSKKPDSLPPDSEGAFLAGYDATVFERPSVAVDVAVLTASRGGLRVALYLRSEHPAKGRWALPGGFVHMDESLDAAAARLLRDKAGLEDVFIEQLYTFGAPGRDPRWRIITVAYYALVDPRRFDEIRVEKGARAASLHVPWSGEEGGPVEARDDAGKPLSLAFDHAEILGTAVKRLRGKLDYSPVGFQLLPAQFTLRALQDVHETVRGGSVNKDSFRRRMLAGGLLEATGEYEREVEHRPAELYRFIRGSAV